MNDKVSIIIPTYNGSNTIERTIKSVFKQSYAHYEIIVVDDGSTDNTVKLVKNLLPHSKIVQQQNQGTLAARQAGLNLAEGSLIAFLDQDDVWFENALRDRLEVFRRHPDVGLVLANMESVDDNGNSLGFNMIPTEKKFSPSWDDLLTLHPIANSVAIFRRDVINKIGGLDTRFGFSGALGDTDTFVRMSEVTKLHYINKPLGLYRWSEIRPGRLFSFLYNLRIYAEKYWGHPRLQNYSSKVKFVQASCYYALHIYRLLFDQYENKVSEELLKKLNENNKFMYNLFGDIYLTTIGLLWLNLGFHQIDREDMRALLFVYLLRRDLQESFAQVIYGELKGFLNWATHVAQESYTAQDAFMIKPFFDKRG